MTLPSSEPVGVRSFAVSESVAGATADESGGAVSGSGPGVFGAHDAVSEEFDRDKRMPLTEHLKELRSRLAKALAAFASMSVVGWAAFQPIMSVLLRPLRASLEDPERPLIAIGVFDPVGLRLKVAGFTGLVLASPVIFWELWRFVAPGLTRRERRTTIVIVVAATTLFCFGVAVAYFTAVPALGFLLRVAGNTVEPLITADRYMSFVLALAAGFGIAFQFPLALVALVALGAVNSRQLIKAWRVVVVAIAVVAAVATPGQDPISFMALFVPMAVFYLGAVGFARFVLRK